MNELDKYKEAYDNVFVLDNELSLNWYPKRILKMAKGDSILELGIGHGFSTKILAEKFKNYVVIDASQEMVNRFYKKFPEVKIKMFFGYFEEVELKEKFDNILMGFVLEHVDDPEIILSKYRKYLKPSGSIFITVPNGEVLHRRFGYEAGMLDDMLKLTSADYEFGHKRVFNLEKLKKLVTSLDYNIEKIEGIFLKPIATQQIIDLKLTDEILNAMLKVGINYPELCNSILMEIKPK